MFSFERLFIYKKYSFLRCQKILKKYFKLEHINQENPIKMFK